MRRFIHPLICLTLALVLTFPTLPANAIHEFVSDDGKIVYILNTSSTCTIFFYAGTESDIVIPSELGGIPVTALAPAFLWVDCVNVWLPTSITLIASGVFPYDCLDVLYLTGDAPIFEGQSFGSEVFATVKYPKGNETYTQALFDRFPNLTWEPYEPEHQFKNGKCILCGSTGIPGDVNNDGEVNSGDVSRLYCHVNRSQPLTGTALQSADINSDGKVNILDVATLYVRIKGTK